MPHGKSVAHRSGEGEGWIVTIEKEGPTHGCAEKLKSESSNAKLRGRSVIHGG